MKRKLCITLDLESDFAGLIPEAYGSHDPRRLHPFFSLIEKEGIKLTVFVVGQLLEENAPVVESLRKLNAEFALHSYSHDLHNPDGRDEIVRGKGAFESYFGRPPLGYRAPQGRISMEGFQRLEEEGFTYDASVFPSFWPSPRYLACPRTPHRPLGSGILEIPFATLPFMRLIVSLSWIKLLGWPVYRWGLSSLPLPEILVFDSHLHDYAPSPDSYDRLPPLWKAVYGRHRDEGLEYFRRFLHHMKGMGYEPAYVSEVRRLFED